MWAIIIILSGTRYNIRVCVQNGNGRVSPVPLHGEEHELLTGRSCFVELRVMCVFFTLNRSTRPHPLWVASKGIGRGNGNGRREDAADEAGRRGQTG